LSPLKDVASVAFDCKSATIVMKPGAKLEKSAIEAALKNAGFGMGEMSEGARPTFVVVRAQVAAKSAGAAPNSPPPSAAALTALASELPRDLPAISDCFVEPDGRATLLVRDEAKGKVDAASLRAALEKRELVLAAFEERHWPKSAASYVATVRAADAATRLRASARPAIESIDNVTAALADRADATRFVVFTTEPCANLEAKLRDALGKAKLELVKLEAR
jgi:hypothetical protein